ATDKRELERDADDDKIKFAYRRLAKFYHPDVYNGRGTLEEGETAESRFIKIQAAYELLIDYEKRKIYDTEHRVNPMKVLVAQMGLKVDPEEEKRILAREKKASMEYFNNTLK
ncbi:Chaperone protein dnaj, partial [Thalictrum thalictroides]